jgi:hypothetical protein
VVTEGCGTCSFKHALLAQLAREQGIADVGLVLGICEMREGNTPGVGPVLAAYGFPWLPEAHCYLRYAGRRFDLAGLPPGSEPPFDALLQEELIEPVKIASE